MASSIINMAAVFGLVKLADLYGLDAPEHTFYLRLSYGSVQVFTFILMYFMYSKITSKNDTTKLSYTEPPKPMSGDDPKLVTTTNRDYDLSKLKEMATQTCVGLAIVAAMHFKWGYLRPLFLQSILGFKTLYQTPIVRITALGMEAKDDLQRPFKAPPSPFGGEAEATPKEVKQAEKKESKKKIANKKTD